MAQTTEEEVKIMSYRLVFQLDKVAKWHDLFCTDWQTDHNEEELEFHRFLSQVAINTNEQLQSSPVC